MGNGVEKKNSQGDTAQSVDAKPLKPLFPVLRFVGFWQIGLRAILYIGQGKEQVLEGVKEGNHVKVAGVVEGGDVPDVDGCQCHHGVERGPFSCLDEFSDN